MAKSKPPRQPKDEVEVRDAVCCCHPGDLVRGQYHPDCAMHNYLPLVATMTMGHESSDRSTHIERLNDTESHNPSDVPGQGVVHTRDTIGGVPRGKV